MNITMSKAHTILAPNLVIALLWMVFVAICALSIKAAYDLTKNSEIFPVWFVPSFILIIAILIALSLYFVSNASKLESNIHPISSRQSAFLWTLMLLSFICTTSVHGFYPFHRHVFWILPALDSIMKINYAIAAAGLIACAVLASIYLFSPMKVLAIIGLLTVALLLLIPNDNCANPFTYWWIETIGASSLMYVPNMYAALFVACGLNGIHSRSARFVTTCICVGSLILGMGHQLGIIW